MGRNNSLDCLKYVLVVLVVIGHFIEPSRYSNEYSCCLYSIIYSFHMPLFIWLNGYFYKQRTLKEEFHKCMPLLETCLLLHFVMMILRDGFSIKGILSFGNEPSWYLFSLIFWRMLSSYWFDKFGVERIFMFSIILEIVTFVCIPKYGGFLSIMRTIQYYPFFLTGYLMKDKLILIKSHKFSVFILGILSMIVIVLTSNRLQHLVLFQRDGLLELTTNANDMGYLYTFVYRYAIITCSILVSAFVLLLSCYNINTNKIAYLGRGTLFIYFGQTILYPFANRFFPELIPSLLASFVAIVILSYFSMKPVSKYFMNPITAYLT